YVARRPNPRDRRGVNVVITPAGRRLVERRRKRGNAWLAARLAGLTPGQRQALAEALGALDAVMAGDDEPAAVPDTPTQDAAAAAREETR
ncbi:MAG: MarR family transcriptional regulator, partial [Actinobacteria bacterium]|nr:MarR family transcriptional regulator [Actinomycetota bacterium]